MNRVEITKVLDDFARDLKSVKNFKDYLHRRWKAILALELMYDSLVDVHSNAIAKTREDERVRLGGLMQHHLEIELGKLISWCKALQSD